MMLAVIIIIILEVEAAAKLKLQQFACFRGTVADKIKTIVLVPLLECKERNACYSLSRLEVV